jgi:hypothetical protein
MEFCQCPSFREKKLPIQDSTRVSKIHIRILTFDRKYDVLIVESYILHRIHTIQPMTSSTKHGNVYFQHFLDRRKNIDDDLDIYSFTNNGR